MSAEQAPQAEQSYRSAKIDHALILHCKLSPADVEQIGDVARRMELSFSEAAVHIGLASPEDLAEVISQLETDQAGATSGIIQTALGKRSSRALVPRHAAVVKADAALVSAFQPENPRSEQIGGLRTALMLINDPGKQANVVALLSPCSGEGRSRLAAELAIAFSQLGQRTLLIDADLRRPQQHVLFGAVDQSGLAQALTYGKPPALLSVERLPQLSLITAGMSVPNPLELLSDGRFERMLMDWRHQYEYIVIDTPPVSEFSDALAIARQARRVLICSRAAKTEHRAMKSMLNRLANTRSRILGAVINQF